MEAGPAHPQLAEETADQLYALPPEQFTAARDAATRTLKAAGRTGEAGLVKALKKPTAAAWALNLLVREDRVQVDALLAVGDELRRAQRALSGDQLRALFGQRRDVVRAVASRAAGLAAAAGHPLSPAGVDQVARSLDAALADPATAEVLLSGRVTAELTYAGLGGESDPVATALTVVPSSTPSEGASPSARAAHRRALADAERAVAETQAELSASAERLTRARDAAAAAALRAASAEETLAAATSELEAASQAEETADRAAALAAKTHQRADARATAAHERLGALRSPY